MQNANVELRRRVRGSIFTKIMFTRSWNDTLYFKFDDEILLHCPIGLSNELSRTEILRKKNNLHFCSLHRTLMIRKSMIFQERIAHG